jgi:pyruvoyl-dependent arginine decarboxylase (PvlArgDC)
MSRFQTDREMAEKLETMMDHRSLNSVLDVLATICREKAEHIRANWQDAATARPWDRAARRIDEVTALAERERI